MLDTRVNPEDKTGQTNSDIFDVWGDRIGPPILPIKSKRLKRLVHESAPIKT